MPDQDDSTARPAVSPPTIDPKRWEDFPAFRETFLRWFTDPAHNAALRSVGALLFEMVLEANRVFPDEPESYTRHDLRAAAADLRCLQGFLGMVRDQREDLDADRPEDADKLRLCKLAARLVPRVGGIADAIEGALG